MKHLCKAEKSDYEKKKYQKIIKDPVVYCKGCGRVSNDEMKVCKPEKLGD